MGKNVEGVFNIARGQRISINELADKIIEIVGVKLKPIHDKPVPEDIRHSLADISLAKDNIGYEPDYSFEKSLEEVIRWFRQ